MKLISIAFLASLLASCTVISGNKQTGTYTMASLGGNLDGYAQTSEGAAVQRIDNAESFRKATNIAHSIIWAKALGAITDSISGALKSTNASDNATQLGIQKSADAVKIKQIEAEAATEALQTIPPAAP